MASHNPLRRPLRGSKRSAFVNPRFFAQKQPSRDRTAEAIAKYVNLWGIAEPFIFVMPSYDALCAKTINRLVPSAIFCGCDYYRSVVEKTDAIDDQGKTVRMQHKSVVRYIEDLAGSLAFDAAFLDYKADYEQKREEIKEFAAKMLKPRAVLAVTVSRGNSDNVVKMMHRDLLAIGSPVIEGSLEYKTNTSMVNAIFRFGS